ncbi:MAG: exo-alpha-sialidase [Clostridia bacterium]|nr:exo-alpha-sialidase [Clostridia bacterium]
MKGQSIWSYAPYKPYFHNTGDIYVNRIAPTEHSVHIEWLDSSADSYSVFYRKRGDEDFIKIADTAQTECDITALDIDTDYEFYVEANGKRSRTRLFRCGEGVGNTVNYLHPDDEVYSYSGRYLCSPSMVRHPDGYLLASMDLYAGACPQNLTLIYRSDDNGETWHYVSELMPCFWGKLFIHKGELYMLACSTEYGDLLIGKSTDGGKTFSAPVYLLRGANGKNGSCGVHKNPQNMLVYNGRLYGTLEWGSWKNTEYYHAAMVMSCDEDADLLAPESWHFSEPVKYDPNWEGVASDGIKGNIEGTLCVAPDGKLYNLMRYQTAEKKILAYLVNTDDPDSPLAYSHPIDFPANLSKFMIKKDEIGGKYYSVATRRIDEPQTRRNLLSLMASSDLRSWEVVCDLIDKRNEDVEKIGFQYVDFEIEGDDIIYLCRTAINGANSYHNSNYMTFHRVKDFRNL